MLITCKCLNIAIEVKGTTGSKLDLGSLKLSPVKSPDNFFSQELVEYEIVSVKKNVAPLVQVKTVGVWMIEHCINCILDCYATCPTKTTALVNAALMSNLDDINRLKNHRDFSPIFRIVVRPLADDTNAKPLPAKHNSTVLQTAFTNLQQQLGEAVQEQVTKTEQKIRSYSEELYEQLGEFRERGNKDHKAIVRILNDAQRPFESENFSSVIYPISIDESTDDYKVPYANKRIIVRSKTEISPTVASSFGGERAAGRGMPNRVLSLHAANHNHSSSFDSEGLFAIEGMEEIPATEHCPSEGESDTDHDDSGSHDEGIDIHRKRTSSIHLARSLPVNVPVYSLANVDLEIDDQDCQDPVDIAASIKALARSVHGDVFGDLPRPRFSTQI